MIREKGELTLANGWVWLVIRLDSKERDTDWHIQGIAADEQLAVEMCEDETYLIGPIPFNTVLPQGRVEWVGSYFPLREK